MVLQLEMYIWQLLMSFKSMVYLLSCSWKLLVISLNSYYRELVMSKEEKEKIAKSIILKEIHEIDFNAFEVKEKGCAACHVLL